MRPLRLSMTAFGPYAGTEHVDFDALADLGLFAVAGNNGSGKTTIFDGLYFALFGSLPGRRATYPRLRSDHAGPDLESRVELDFVAHGELWRIERSPKQERAKRRGQGRTESQQRATLSRIEDGQAIAALNRIAEVNAKCRELVGLTGPQFERVALLPQGEFSRLLTESGSERRELLRALFSSEIFGSASSLLTADAGTTATSNAIAAEHFDQRVQAVADQVRTMTGSVGADPAAEPSLDALTTLVGDYRATTITDLSTQVDELRAAVEVQTTALNNARQLSHQLAQRAIVRDALDRHERQRVHHEADLQRLRLARAAIPVIDMATVTAHQTTSIHRIADRVRQSQNQLAQLLPACGITSPVPRTSTESHDLSIELDERHRHATAQVAAHDQVRKLRDAVATIDHELSGLERREHTMRSDRLAAGNRRDRCEGDLEALAAITTVAQATNDREQRDQELAQRTGLCSLDQEQREIRSHHDKLAGDCAAIDERLRTSEQAQQRQAGLNETAQQAVRALTDLEQRKANRLDFDSTTARLNEVRQRHIVAQRQSDQLFDGFIRGSSARLAETLIDGEPCTVCGSTQHPEPAPQATDAISQAQVQTARDIADDMARQRAELEQHIEHLHALDPELSHASPQSLAHEVAAAKSFALAAESAANENHRHVSRIDRLRQQRADLDGRISAAADAASETDRQRHQLIGSLGDLARESVATIAERAAQAATDLDRSRHAHDERVRMTAELHALDSQIETIDIAHLAVQQNRTALLAERAARRDDLDAAEAVLDDGGKAGNDTQPASQLTITQRARSTTTALITALAEHDTATDNLRRAQLQLADRLGPSPFHTTEQAELACLDTTTMKQLDAATTEWAAAGERLQGELGSLGELPDIGPNVDALHETAAATAQQFEAAHRELIEQAGASERLAQELAELLAEQTSRRPDELAARRLERVAALVKGDNDHNTSLENWVLAAHLREVVELANVRLARSTHQRFQLCVLDDGETRRGRWGLDLAVEDTVTGTRRPTAGLSGGELFQASLALALGLADVVMNQSAGVRIDALFIDEGFGSLDEASVERVIDLLDDVRSRGATVGVITHVAALLDVLPRGITVVAHQDGRGSTIKQPRRAA